MLKNNKEQYKKTLNIILRSKKNGEDDRPLRTFKDWIIVDDIRGIKVIRFQDSEKMGAVVLTNELV